MHYYQFNIADYQSHTKHLTPIEDICYRRLLDWQYLHEKPIPNDIKSMCRLLMLRDYQEDVEQILGEFFVLTAEGWVNHRAFEEIQEFYFHDESNRAREENEKERQKRHRDERKKLFADLREKGIVPAWDILISPLRELHKLHCGKQKASAPTGNATETDQEQTCNAPATAITINQEPVTINQEPYNPPIPPLEIEEEKPKSTPPSDDGLTCESESHFDTFWKAYPKKVGKDHAAKTFKKIKKPSETLTLILEALAWQINSEQWTRDSGQYIPNPSTYLNAGRWKDEKPPDNVINRRRVTDFKKFSPLDAIYGGDGYGNRSEETGNIIDIGGGVANSVDEV